jgi:hypothetical protein
MVQILSLADIVAYDLFNVFFVEHQQCQTVDFVMGKVLAAVGVANRG